MRRPSLESVANIAIILAATAVLLKFSGVLDRPANSPLPRAQVPQYVAGEKLATIEGLDLRKSDRTLLLVLHKYCKYCTEGMPFFRDIMTKRNKNSTQVVVVSRNSIQDLTAYLKENQLLADGQVSIGETDKKMQLTPTVLLVDRSGTISSVWTGLPNDRSKVEVIHAVE